MKLNRFLDYKSHLERHAKHKYSIISKSNLFHNEIEIMENEENSLQQFADSIQEIKNSIDIYNRTLNLECQDDEQLQDCKDLLNDSILHIIRLFEYTKHITDFNDFSDLSNLQRMINFLFAFDNDSEIFKSFLHMMAYLSSTKLFFQLEIMENDKYFQYIIESANNFLFHSFLILYNYSLENQENAKKVYFHFPPAKILDLFETNFGNPESVFDDQFYTSVLSLISAYCHYNCDESIALEILTMICNVILFCKSNPILLSEAFYALSMLHIYCECCIKKANEINIFDCFNELINLDLDSSIITTMMIYYGESYLHHYREPNLNLDKIVNYAKSDDIYLSSTALWLIWTMIDEDIKPIDVFYTDEFFHLLKSIISDNQFIGGVKLSLLLLSLLIENATVEKLEVCGCDDLVNLIMESNYLESEDELLVNHILRAFGRLQRYYAYIGKEEFTEYLITHLNDLDIMALTEEHKQYLLKYYPLLAQYV